jgi:hypothetical protein
VSVQRHRIRRQVLEVILRDQGAAWQLSSELSRIQSRSLEAIIDRCCTEAGDPDRLHRIESLEVDLGRIDLDNLEHDLVERLGRRLHETLAARIRTEDHATSLAGADPETISRLELVAFFARTGSLPWWADGSRPRLLDEAVGLLLQRAAGPLVALVRTLARDRGELRRLVLHCEDERLSALFAALVAALVASGPRGVAQRAAELRSLLTAHPAIAGVLPSSFRSAIWVAALRAAITEENARADAVRFWRAALVQAALELGVTYTFLVTSLHAREPSPADQPDAAAPIVQRLYREVQGETVASDSALRESVDDVAGWADEWKAMVDRVEQLGIERSALVAGILRVLEELEASAPADAVREARSLLQRWIEKHGGDTAAHQRAAAANRDGAAADAPAAHGETPGDIRSLRELDDPAGVPASLPPDIAEEAKRLLREAIEQPSDDSDGRAGTAQSTATAADASRRRLARALVRTLDVLARAVEASPAQAESPPLDLAYADSEDVYVENAGLAILWPFLGHLFERLGLMADKRFNDPAAQHRAVGLLQHLTTADPWPQEYQLLLAKVLCGMAVDEVFDFGPPVTEAEAEEGAGMLTAVIANAPVLRDMSIDGFRGSFLLRKGVLGTRDGAWLLRVERATHDVVLDRFPWAVSWVKLPWMEAPLSVEW